jgi:phosphatidylglycerophosphate synthase
MLANWITLFRFPLLLATVLILYGGSPGVRVAGVALLFLGLMLDTVDGVVARSRGETSLFGSVLDIAADRTYELILWVCFADLGMISVAVPLIIIARTTLTDAFRSIGVGQGTAPFAQHRTALGRFLVGSSWMRTGYDAVLLDPPRVGAREVLSAVAHLAPRRVVYISCHTGSLARDLGILTHEMGFRLRAAGVLDMFPHTTHVESVAVLERK